MGVWVEGGGGICSSSHRNNHYSLQVNDDCAVKESG